MNAIDANCFLRAISSMSPKQFPSLPHSYIIRFHFLLFLISSFPFCHCLLEDQRIRGSHWLLPGTCSEHFHSLSGGPCHLRTWSPVAVLVLRVQTGKSAEFPTFGEWFATKVACRRAREQKVVFLHEFVLWAPVKPGWVCWFNNAWVCWFNIVYHHCKGIVLRENTLIIHYPRKSTWGD